MQPRGARAPLRRGRRGAARLASAASALVALGCGAGGSAPAAVVASIEPLAMLLRELAPPGLEVHALLPPGASPHGFEARPSDLRRVAGARLLVQIGGHYDGWAARLAAAAEVRPERLALLELPGIDALPAADPHAEPAGAGLDPHLWLDPVRAAEVIAPALAAALARVAPEAHAEIGARLAAQQQRLRALDAELRALFAAGAAERRGFVALHDSWRYFARRYGLRELGAVLGVGAEEPTPRSLAALVRRARAQGGAELLIEPQLPAAVAATLARELEGRTRRVDPLGDPADPARADYASLLRWNARAFAAATAPAARAGT